MSGGGLVEVLRAEAGGCGRLGLPCHLVHEREFWCWACNHAAHLADVVTAHLAARLEGCRSDGTFADRLFWWNRGEDPYFVIHGRAGEVAEGDPYQPIADAAIAIVRSALGLEPPSDALGGASDGRTGRSGTSMQGDDKADRAVRMYCERLRRSNPRPEVLAVLDEIDRERGAQK